ncbi:hypothetical protein L2E82_18695 [Cichorium intybus]|uniref:Uncharacterized protein n=1 Tax=Cichorium intybus TaxID=13427 RepID=A0ACB9FA65_CICIN|nr:hypothetical protein L2E82_18695 [Cichorium intybus]
MLGFQLLNRFLQLRLLVDLMLRCYKVILGLAWVREDVESDDEVEHVSCNDESEKESDNEDTFVSGEKCMSKERCQASNVILEKAVEDGEIPVERASEVSDDPFGFYPLLHNQNKKSKAPSPIVDAASAQTPTHPRGYTHSCSLPRQEGENGDDVVGLGV